MDAKTLYRNSENLKQQYSQLLDTDKALAEECWAAAQILKAEAGVQNHPQILTADGEWIDLPAEIEAAVMDFFAANAEAASDTMAEALTDAGYGSAGPM